MRESIEGQENMVHLSTYTSPLHSKGKGFGSWFHLSMWLFQWTRSKLELIRSSCKMCVVRCLVREWLEICFSHLTNRSKNAGLDMIFDTSISILGLGLSHVQTWMSKIVSMPNDPAKKKLVSCYICASSYSRLFEQRPRSAFRCLATTSLWSENLVILQRDTSIKWMFSFC